MIALIASAAIQSTREELVAHVAEKVAFSLGVADFNTDMRENLFMKYVLGCLNAFFLGHGTGIDARTNVIQSTFFCLVIFNVVIFVGVRDCSRRPSYLESQNPENINKKI